MLQRMDIDITTDVSVLLHIADIAEGGDRYAVTRR